MVETNRIPLYTPVLDGIDVAMHILGIQRGS